ncbi:hypothetical protein TWF481_003104 [Arthrobotrys musiformis]|uniref:Uncharacterized protein n=1 Tax=Arthrobotrys musiformis TaxID=47236 RepID=A0AAV9VQH7_9PEZI
MKSAAGLSLLCILAIPALAKDDASKATSASCANFTALGGPLGNFCPLYESNSCCSWICHGPGGQPGACAQSSISGVGCTQCSTLAPAPTCSSTAKSTAKAGLDLDSCGKSWDPCCAYVCRENNSASTSVPVLCVASPTPGMWCLECPDRPTGSLPAPSNAVSTSTAGGDYATSTDKVTPSGTKGSGNGTETGVPQPTYSSAGDASVSLGLGALAAGLILTLML